MKRPGVPGRCAALDVTFGSIGAIGVLILTGCLVSAFSKPSPPRQEIQGVSEVSAALDTLRSGRGAFVDAMRHGSVSDLRRVAAARDRALDRLARELGNTNLLRTLGWEERTQWLEVSLIEHREDWGRPLLDVWASSLPKRGDPRRGRAALALALVALRLTERDPEEGSAYLAGPPMRSLDAVVEDALETAAGEFFPLRDEAMARLATLAESEGDTTAALEWADSLLAWNDSSPHAPLARAIRARSLFAMGADARVIEEVRREPPIHLDLLWLDARALTRMGRSKEAVGVLENLIARKPADPLAMEAFKSWLEMTTADPSFGRGSESATTLLSKLRSHPETESMYRRLEARPELSAAEKANVSLALTQHLYRAKRYDEALSRAEELAKSSLPTVALEARLIQARIHRNLGRLEPMERIYRSVLETRSASSAQAGWELAKEWESRTRWKDAEQAYSEVLSRFPEDENRGQVQFRRGFTRWQQHKRQDALTDFQRAHQIARTAADRERAAFWTARTLWDMGRRRQALLVARRNARTREPADAYGVLLRDRFAVPENARYLPEPAFETTRWEAIESRPLPPAREDIGRAYRNILDRLELGLYEAARAEWERLETPYGRDRSGNWSPEASVQPLSPRMLVSFAVAGSAYDFYPEATEWARNAQKALDLTPRERMRMRRLSYPAAYTGAVVSDASRHGLDPAWIWALMRQESFYNPEAMSWRGALGLMQIMPATLSRLAAETGTPPLPAEVLFRPYTNIGFGTRFFADRMAEFDGHLLPTLASYNAGEGKSREWIERAKGDTQEVFLECIGYPETYDYVRRILWNTWLYHYLYSEGNTTG